MTFVSYAQNFEDVMLWRALHHIEKGFYIDVGANDPSIDSVTKAFYEKGWRGINIEPLSSYYADLQRERPRDINLCCAAGQSDGEIEIWEGDISGWSTVDSAVIARHVAAGDTGKIDHKVPMVALANICTQYAPPEIHFLKVDVEGFERQVLEGMDFQRFRPWVVVVEATLPNSTEEVHHQWEDLLLAANYVLVYADGLNRFYLAQEHRELIAAFKYPPNVFDDFVRYAHLEADRRAQEAEAQLRQYRTQVQHTEEQYRQVEARAQRVEAALQTLKNSTSWRLTKPLRVLGRFIK